MNDSRQKAAVIFCFPHISVNEMLFFGKPTLASHRDNTAGKNREKDENSLHKIWAALTGRAGKSRQAKAAVHFQRPKLRSCLY